MCSGSPTRRRACEDNYEDQQDQSDIAGKQKEAEVERQQEPITASALANRTPEEKQAQSPQGCGKDRGTEVRARHSEGGNADHQQYCENCVSCADNAAAKSEHCPVGDDNAGLRQSIKAETAADPESNLAQPECQGRSEIAAEDEFSTNRQQQRHIPWRGAVKNSGDQGPERGLRQRSGPEDHCRASTQEFNKQGNVMHWPARGYEGGNRAGIKKPR